MSYEDILVKMAEKNGWLVAEVAQLRWELWGQMELPVSFRSELHLPRTVREGVQMLIREEWSGVAEQYLAKPPFRDGSRDPNEIPIGLA